MVQMLEKPVKYFPPFAAIKKNPGTHSRIPGLKSSSGREIRTLDTTGMNRML